jgi:hypothetical protein
LSSNLYALRAPHLVVERELRAEGVPAPRSPELLRVQAIKQCALASLCAAMLPEVVVHRAREVARRNAVALFLVLCLGS